MMKWGAADLIRYHVVGVYQDKPRIASDGAGQADVTDRVVFDFTWKLSEMELVGAPTFLNLKTTVANPAIARASACRRDSGDDEHYELLG